MVGDETQPRGRFIVLEGLDRAGKTTQHDRLCNHLRAKGRSVESMRFPDRQTATGAAISAYLKGTCDLSDHAVHLLFAANRWEARQAIMDAIAAGADVVVDRYYYSGMVYSVAKGLPNLDLQWARAPEVGLPRPDLVFFLDLSAEAAAGRGQFGEEKYESVAMQGKVRSVFMEVIRSEGRGSGLTKIIDASAGIDEVAASICRVVDSLPDPKHALLCIA